MSRWGQKKGRTLSSPKLSGGGGEIANLQPLAVRMWAQCGQAWFFSQNKHAIWDWGCSLVTENLPNMQKALGSIPSTRKRTEGRGKEESRLEGNLANSPQMLATNSKLHGNRTNPKLRVYSSFIPSLSLPPLLYLGQLFLSKATRGKTGKTNIQMHQIAAINCPSNYQ